MYKYIYVNMDVKMYRCIFGDKEINRIDRSVPLFTFRF